MNINKLHGQMARWLALADALSTINEQSRYLPRNTDWDVVHDIVEMLRIMWEQICVPEGDVYFTLYIDDEEGVVDMVKEKDAAAWCFRYEEVSQLIKTTNYEQRLSPNGSKYHKVDSGRYSPPKNTGG